jgi:hypothetical protein
MRVGTSIAGNKWGTKFIPRIGQEVIVDFLEGDPDQPIIIGSVYNASTMPHYELPKFKTLSYIKTRTSPDNGKGWNELRFEDKAKKEQVFIHSQKRYDLRAKGSMYETCGGNRQQVIGYKVIVDGKEESGGNLATTVGGNFDLHICGDHFITIDGALYEGVKGDVAEEYKGKQQTVVTGKHELNAQEITLEALTKITLKVGGKFCLYRPFGCHDLRPDGQDQFGRRRCRNGPDEVRRCTRCGSCRHRRTWLSGSAANGRWRRPSVAYGYGAARAAVCDPNAPRRKYRGRKWHSDRPESNGSEFPAESTR